MRFVARGRISCDMRWLSEILIGAIFMHVSLHTFLLHILPSIFNQFSFRFYLDNFLFIDFQKNLCI